MSDFVLAKIDQARRLLAEAKTVQEAKQHPELAERRFTLRPAPKQARYVPRPQERREGDGSKSAKIPRGALARAVKAGLVSPGLVGAFA